MEVKRFDCPCCGYRNLEHPAYSEMPQPLPSDLGNPPYIGRYGMASFQCCDCCGFEFGFDDDASASGRETSFEEHLRRFVQSGMPWFRPDCRPEGWDLEIQLRQAGISHLAFRPKWER
jgi:hypothetical protein